MSMLKARDVEEEIRRQWAEAHARKASYVDIRAGDVHRGLGGQNRVPQVCQVMMRLRDPEDLVIDGPPSGQSTSLTVRYLLPRESNKVQEPTILAERPLADYEPREADERRRANHDAYGKLIMRNAAGNAFSDSGALCRIRFGEDAAEARIDGVVGNSIAVEIESRTPKQIRGAVLDLIFHPYPRKLLLIIAGHQNDARQAANQCKHILREEIGDENVQVVLLAGNGREHQQTGDVALVREALGRLGWGAKEIG
jgi:hypothetical protein